MQFLKYVLATIIGIILFFILSIFILAGIGSLFSAGDSTTTVSENSVLKLNLDSEFSEMTAAEDPFSEMFAQTKAKIGLKDFKEVLSNAALDPNIKGVSLQLNNPGLGFGQLAEVITALKSFKKSGKFIYSNSTYLSEKAALIVAVADSSFINPNGAVEFNGLDANISFFKGALDKLGVEPLVFRVGSFKSAVEPYIRTNMSEENREQVKSYLNSVADVIYNEYASIKKITRTEVDQILNKASMFTAEESVQNKLVSRVAYDDEFESALKLKLGIKKKINFVSFGKYKNAQKYVKAGSTDSRIAVIVSEGEIAEGKNSMGVIGSDDVVKELKKARKDSKIKAIVLRINSPGGSAVASDIMWREIQLTKKVKPVIASMGDVAASGGYYMAMGCDTIVAHPATITGSIGIFGLMMNYQKLMNEKLGVTFDGVKTHEFADSPAMDRKMSDAEKQTIQNMVNLGYENFTSKAAQGRKMPIEKLKELAGGRVWTGAQAKANGLVDVLGGLDQAIEIAAVKAKLKAGAYQVRYYPYPKTELEQIMDLLNKKSEDAKLTAYFGGFLPVYRQWQSLQKLDKMQARLPYIIDIH